MSGVYGLRNTTSSTITIYSSTAIAAGSTWIFYNSETRMTMDICSIETSLESDPSGINLLLSNGSLIFVIDGVDQTASTFYSTWKNIIQPTIVSSSMPMLNVLPVAGFCTNNLTQPTTTKTTTSINTPTSTGFYVAPINTTNTLSVSSTGTTISNCNQGSLLCTKPGLNSQGQWTSYVDSYGSTINHTSTSIAADMTSAGNLAVSIVLLGDTTSHYPYAGVSFDLTNNGTSAVVGNKTTFDCSAYTGITISYLATTSFKLQLEGNSDTDGANWFYQVPVSATQTTITILWSQFAQPTWVSGNQVRTIPKAALDGIKFQYDTAQSSCAFTLFSVSFAGTGPFIAGTSTVSPTYSSIALTKINSWFNHFYVENSTNTQGRITWISGTNVDPTVTVSEGIGYGMLLALIACSSTSLSEQYRQRFDRMWAYYQASADSNGLMNWKMSAFTGSIIGSGSAPDADMDVCKALLLAYERFMDSKYLNAAIVLMNSIWTYEIMYVSTNNGYQYLIAPGDSWTSYCNPSYQAKLTAIKLFSYYDTNSAHLWSSVYTASIWQLTQNQTNQSSCYGLPSNWCDYNGVPVIGSSSLGFGWDACRVLFHLSETYRLFGDSNAYNLLLNIANNSTLTTDITNSPWTLQLSFDPSGNMGKTYSNSTWSASLSSDYNTVALGVIACAYYATAKLNTTQLNSILNTIVTYSTDESDYFRLAMKCFILAELTGLFHRYGIDAGSAAQLGYIINVAGPSETQTTLSQIVLPLAGGSPQYRMYSNGSWGSLSALGGVTPNVGTATLSFGSFPGSNLATTTVTGQTNIKATSVINLQISAVATGSYTASDIKFLASQIELAYDTVVAGTGFTIYASSSQKLQGSITIDYTWI